MDPSGVRMGTPALTTRGLREDAIRRVASWIVEVLDDPEDAYRAERVRSEIREFAEDYPVPADLVTSS
jgi:glycine hydroxymethyltransferase